MKSFKDVCMMSQPEVKAYMYSYLANKKYKVVNEPGFLYAEGDIPVLLMAHMDTVHKDRCNEIVEVNGKISSPQGIGGDDRCGIFMIMNLVKTHKCSVLLCEDEEIGATGARAFTQSKYVKEVDVNYIVEFDRRGSNDAVFYSCDNPDFNKFVCDTTGMAKAYGTFSDISIVAPVLGIAAVNLSSGYYSEHTKGEYVIYSEMMDVINRAKNLIDAPCEQFEYVEKKYSYSYGTLYEPNWIGAYYDEKDVFNSNDAFKNRIKDDRNIEIEVVWTDGDDDERVAYGSGLTKAEAWLDFFMTNEDVNFSMITDYSFC